MPSVDDPRILVGTNALDDAAVFQMGEDRAVVATVDFFAPIVDDAYNFGAIAAANALSDLYAMGSKPLFALNLVAWPRDPEMLELLGQTIRGGADKVREAGAFVLGGHSIDDKEPKYGLVAIGEAPANDVVTCGAAQPGDKLILTKPIGTGILSTALKRDMITEQEMSDAVKSMTTLNAGAANAMRSLGDAVHSATDVTGFGLIGHLKNLLGSAGVGALIHAGAVPRFPSVQQELEAGAVPGGTKRNVDAAAAYTEWSGDVPASERTLLCDAQTSGGLLIAVHPDHVDRLVDALEKNQTPAAAVVGEITKSQSRKIEVVN